MDESDGRERPTLREAMQRHHDVYILAGWTHILDRLEVPQLVLAIRRERSGDVEPLSKEALHQLAQEQGVALDPLYWYLNTYYVLPGEPLE